MNPTGHQVRVVRFRARPRCGSPLAVSNLPYMSEPRFKLTNKWVTGTELSSRNQKFTGPTITQYVMG